MKSTLLALFFLTLVTSYAAPSSPVGASINVPPYKWNGRLVSTSSYGSGFVVRQPNTVVTAAHIIYDHALSTWNPTPYWFLRYDSVSAPFFGGQLMDGSVYSATYASFANVNPNSVQSFHLDYAVSWSYAPTAAGEKGDSYTSGAPALQSGAQKLLTGYPTSSTGNHNLYSVGIFTSAFSPVYGAYLESPFHLYYPDLGGNSGGPLWVYNAPGGNWGAAGIFLSQDNLGGIGVRAIDSDIINAIDVAQDYSDLQYSVSFPKGTTINTNQSISTAKYRLVMQGDGNLVLYEIATNLAVWHSHTYGVSKNTYKAVFQSDGNLVIYNGGLPIWNTTTSGEVFNINGDGNMVIYSATGTPLWDSKGTLNKNSHLTYSANNLYFETNQTLATNKARLSMQADGKLVLYRLPNYELLWASPNGNSGGNHEAAFQSDGNFILTTNSAVKWATYSLGGSLFYFQPDANLVIRHANGTPLWWTGTYVP